MRKLNLKLDLNRPLVQEEKTSVASLREVADYSEITGRFSRNRALAGWRSGPPRPASFPSGTKSGTGSSRALPAARSIRLLFASTVSRELCPSVRRFIAKLKQTTPAATVMLDFSPGDAAQVDFGSGPEIVDAFTGKSSRPISFVMHARLEPASIRRDRARPEDRDLARCHSRAFAFFGGVPSRIIIDNPKCAITKACYHDPEVQRSYAEFAEGYAFLVSPCPPRDPQKKGRWSLASSTSRTTSCRYAILAVCGTPMNSCSLL